MKKLSLSLFVLLLSACATSVNVDYTAGEDFARIKTFFVQTRPVDIAADTRIDSPMVKQRIVRAIADNLAAKGLSTHESDPDVTVKYHLAVKPEIESSGTGVTLGLGTVSHHTLFGIAYGFPERDISSVDNLMMTIDMFDAKEKLLWRGSLARRLYDGSTPESNTALINGMVAEILSRFPPG